MNEQITVEPCDTLLSPFLQAADRSTAEGLLAQLLLEHAEPIIKKIIASKLRVAFNGTGDDQADQDALDLASEVRTSLIGDLRMIQQQTGRRSITSFRDYVAVKTYFACADHFRRKNPRRARLKDKLRNQLKQDQRFALWRADDNRWYAGSSSWIGTAPSQPVTMPSSGAILARFPQTSAQEVTPAEFLSALFDQTGQPVEFDPVVGLAAEVWSINDGPDRSMDDPGYQPGDASLGPTAAVDVQLEQRLYLEALWTEVCELPALQRAALLLNLRDAQGGSAIFFLPHLGIASPEKIAQALDIPEQEFVALWNDLPLDDLRIAERLGITRQQVINLRKTARERLMRRMERAERGGSEATAKGKKQR